MNILQYKFPKINFIGNKEKIVDWIADNLPTDVESVFDAFSGGASVSFKLKNEGYKLVTNDIMKINYLISKGLIENKEVKLTEQDLENIFKGKPLKGFMFNNYSNVIFLPEECMELDLYRVNIGKINNIYKKALAFILIRRAMVRKMPYSRFNLNWDKITQLRDEEYSYKMYGRKRAYHNLSFKEHILENYEDYNNAVFDNEKTNLALNLNIFELFPLKNRLYYFLQIHYYLLFLHFEVYFF